MIRFDNTPFASLAAHLLDLLKAVEDKNIPIILVGGFGLILRQERIRASGEDTLFPSSPFTRTTRDLDLLLSLEALADVGRMSALRDAINQLGYQAVPRRENYQFFLGDETPTAASEDRKEWRAKIDLLARQPEADDPPSLVIKGYRIMPRNDDNPLHAYLTPEAIAAEEMLQRVGITGQLTNGETYQEEVLLPHPYAFYLMKLFAFRDEQAGGRRPPREEYAQKHARDLYTVTQLLTRTENSELAVLKAKYQSHPIAQEAGRIVRDFFRDPISGGAVRIRETGGAEHLSDFLSLLAETFPEAEGAG